MIARAKPLKRTRVKRSKKTRARNRMIAALDADCRRSVFERDKVCVRCGSADNPQWSHIVTRRHKCLRWDENNSVQHCRDCHCWYTYNPVEGAFWFGRLYPERREYIERVLRLNLEFGDTQIRELWERLGK